MEVITIEDSIDVIISDDSSSDSWRARFHGRRSHKRRKVDVAAAFPEDLDPDASIAGMFAMGSAHDAEPLDDDAASVASTLLDEDSEEGCDEDGYGELYDVDNDEGDANLEAVDENADVKEGADDTHDGDHVVASTPPSAYSKHNCHVPDVAAGIVSDAELEEEWYPLNDADGVVTSAREADDAHPRPVYVRFWAELACYHEERLVGHRLRFNRMFLGSMTQGIEWAPPIANAVHNMTMACVAEHCEVVLGDCPYRPYKWGVTHVIDERFVYYKRASCAWKRLIVCAISVDPGFIGRLESLLIDAGQWSDPCLNHVLGKMQGVYHGVPPHFLYLALQ